MHTVADIAPTHQTPWEAAIYEVAARAKAALGPASHPRIDKAVQIVLAGGVTLNDDHSAVVASQSQPLTGWSVNGSCACPDFANAPAQLCKHRIACHIQRRALERAAAPFQAERQATVQACTLPEAPASVNVHITISGRDVQVTLRDTDEGRLLQRLAAVLAQYPVAAVSAPVVQGTEAQPTPEGWCLVHGVQMRRNSNDRGSWWSHKHGEGWCRGKGK